MSEEILVIGILVFVCIIIPIILYLFSLKKAFNLAGENNRTMSPGLVWLNLIPVFSLFWHIYTVVKLSQSIGNWFKEAGKEDEGNGGLALGLTVSILAFATIIPQIGELAAIVWVVVWIIYWVKIGSYNEIMQKAP